MSLLVGRWRWRAEEITWQCHSCQGLMARMAIPPHGQELGWKQLIKKQNPTLQKSSLGSGKSSTSGYSGGKSHQPLWPVVCRVECRWWDKGSDIWEVSKIMTIWEYPGVTGCGVAGRGFPGSGRSWCGRLTESSAHELAASLPVVQSCEAGFLRQPRNKVPRRIYISKRGKT